MSTIKTYGLAIENKQGLVPLRLPLMDKETAFQYRSLAMAATSKPIHVINRNAQ
jgi:hypothetical protein